VIVRSLDHDVANIDHRHSAQAITVSLDVIPTRRAFLQRLAVRELLPRRVPGSRRPELLTSPVTRLRCATVKRDSEKRHLCRHIGQLHH
jgi:hypothetical protein